MSSSVPFFLLFAVLSIAGVGSNVVLEVNQAVLDVIKLDKPSPPVVSRSLAMVQLALFDTLNGVAGQPYKAFAHTKVAAPQVIPELAAARAGSALGALLFPTRAAMFDKIFDDYFCRTNASATTKLSSAFYGSEVANTVWSSRLNDGSQRTDSCYSFNSSMGMWQMTPRPHPHKPEMEIGGAPPLLPRWGFIRPFTMSAEQIGNFTAGPPLSITSSEYTAEFNEVKQMGSKVSSLRTEDQSQIATFWAGNSGTVTPPGQWNVIARDVIASLETPPSLLETARLFALLDAALADAAISTWRSKYTYHCWRPITAIRNADMDENPDTEVDFRWTPLLATPNHPDHTSGHSSFSGAASVVLASFFGKDNTPFSTQSQDFNPPRSRSFTSFSQAAEEAAESRLYGGIHFRRANSEGLRAGRALGRAVVDGFLLPRST